MPLRDTIKKSSFGPSKKYRGDKRIRSRSRQEITGMGVSDPDSDSLRQNRGLTTQVPKVRSGGEYDNPIGNFLLGVKSGVVEGLAWIPDAAFNRVLDAAEGAGVIDKGHSRDSLSRMINSGDYEDVEKVLGFINFGKGEDVGFQSAAARIGDAAGEFATMGLGITGIAKGVAKLSMKGLAMTGSKAEKAAALIAKGESKALARVTSKVEKSTGLVGKRASEIIGKGAQREAAISHELGSAGESIRRFGREQFLAPAVRDVGALAKREVVGGAIGGGIFQGFEEAAEGSGSVVMAAAATAIALPWMAKRSAGNAVLKTMGIIKKAPSSRLFNWIRTKSASKELEQETKGPVAIAMQNPGNKAELAKATENTARIKKVTGEDVHIPTAEATQDPLLLAQKRSMESRMPMEESRDTIESKLKNLNITSNFGKTRFETVDNFSPEIIVSNFGRKIKDLKTLPAKQLESAEARQAALAGETGVDAGLPRLSNRVSTGEDMRNIIVTRRNIASEKVEKFYKSSNLDNTQTLAGVKPMREAVIKRLEEELGYVYDSSNISEKGIPDVIKNFLKTHEFGNKTPSHPEGQISFGDYKLFRQQVSSALDKAHALRQNGNISVLSTLKSGLDEGAKGFRSKNVTSNYTKYLDMYKKEVIEPFESNTIHKITGVERLDRYGARLQGVDTPKYVYKTKGEQVGESFLKDSESAQEFMRMYGGVGRYAEPEMSQLDAMRNVVLDKAHDGSGIIRGGRIDPEKLRSFISKDREIYDILKVPHPKTGELVTMSSILEDAALAQESIVSRIAQVRGRADKINSVEFFRKIENVAGEQTYDEIMEAAIKNKNNMDMLVKQVNKGTPEEIEANKNVLRQWIYNHATQDSKTSSSIEKILDKSGESKFALRDATKLLGESPQKFVDWLAKNENVLRKGLGSEYFDDIVVMADTQQRILSSGMNTGKMQGNDIIAMFQKWSGVTPQGWSARMINMFEGRVSPRTSFVWLAGQAARANQFRMMDDVFKESMFNTPFRELMKKVVMNKNGEVPIKQARVIRRALIEAGIMPPMEPKTTQDLIIPFKGIQSPQALPYLSQPPVPVQSQTPAPQVSSPPPSVSNTPVRPQLPPVNGQQAQVEQLKQANQFESLFPDDNLGKLAAQSGIGAL